MAMSCVQYKIPTAAMAPKGIPNYKLLDATGKIIAEGEEAKTKAKHEHVRFAIDAFCLARQ
jgi:hypothetical protein